MALHLKISPAVLIMFLAALAPSANSKNFSFPSFQSDSTKQIDYQGDAFTEGNVTHLTKVMPGEPKDQSCGRALYGEPVHLWDRATRLLADFTTHFTFIMKNLTDVVYSGDGLAFFIAENGSQIPEQYSKGGYLCLFSNSNSYKTSIVAVEFDTYSNTWDPKGETTPDGDHIGIDINSIISNKTKVWSTHINRGVTGKAWVNYNASTMELGVFLSFEDQPVYEGQFDLLYVVDLVKFLPEWVSVGFSAATGMYAESHQILSWEFTSNLENKIQERSMGSSPSPSPAGSEMGGNHSTIVMPRLKSELDKKIWNKTIIVVAVVLIIAAIGGVLSLIWFILWRKKPGSNQASMGNVELAIDEEIEQNGAPKRFSYNELSTAANDFSDDGLLGKGGFGSVHKGILKDMNNIPVAVKRLSKDSQQGKKEYVSEVKAISRLRHKNLVKLIGWCHEGGEFLLVYELMPNRSLDRHLFEFDNRELIPWTNRLKIIRGLASALLYLHEECGQCVLHRDIKSSNVMLDSDFNAKLGDFGLARVINQEEEGNQSSLVAGSTGYLAPERYFSFKATKESDIYSFGIVVLEVACGRRPIEHHRIGQVVMVEWAWSLYGVEKVIEAADERLNGEFNEEQMVRLIVTGLWCAHPEPSSRPSIMQVISTLNDEVPLPLLPLKMPVPAYSATHSVMGSSSITGATSSCNSRSQCSPST